MYTQLERKFTRPFAISECLKCPICFMVFNGPLKLSCGHTICKPCMQYKSNQPYRCFICRQAVDLQSTGVDLIATNIINELEVMCADEDCPWTGALEKLEKHYGEECVMKEIEKEKKQEAMEDEEVMERLNANTMRGSLVGRLILKSQEYGELMKERAGKGVE